MVRALSSALGRACLENTEAEGKVLLAVSSFGTCCIAIVRSKFTVLGLQNLVSVKSHETSWLKKRKQPFFKFLVWTTSTPECLRVSNFELKSLSDVCFAGSA